MANKNKLHLLNLASFLLGFQAALIAYVNSSFLEKSTGLFSVGFFYFLGFAGSLLVLLNTHHLAKRYGKSKVFFVFMTMKMLSLAGVALFAQSKLGVIFAVWVLMSGQLMWTALDVMVESFSQDKVTGSIRGLHLAIMNSGWVFAPLLATRLVEDGNYWQVYSIGAVIVLVVLAMCMLALRHVNHNVKRDLRLKEVFRKLMHQKNVARIYYVSLTLEIFYAAMVVYTPLYMLSLSPNNIGPRGTKK